MSQARLKDHPNEGAWTISDMHKVHQASDLGAVQLSRVASDLGLLDNPLSDRVVHIFVPYDEFAFDWDVVDNMKEDA